MDNLARLHPAPEYPAPTFASGRVQRALDGAFRVSTDGAEFDARRAAGCLLEPAPGDRVALYVDGAEAWVVTVLDRRAGTASDVVLDGDATVRSRDGSVTVRGPRGVRLESPEEVRAVTGRFRVVAERAELAARQLLAVGRVFEAEVRELRAHAGRLDAIVDHVTQRFRTALKMVDDADIVRAGRVDYRAEQVASLQGSSTVVTARDVIKVDGQQIQLG